MGLTICTFAGALRSFGRWLTGTPGATASSTVALHSAGMRLHTAAGRAHVAWPPARRTGSSRRPLRVLRVVDAEHAASTAGRMVISGRMADVCAELDRLAALEAAAA
ncbi:hypothetical protein EZ313_20365 [Ramlibacter henchirensis]|uniref:Uncharacterized protein n=1 Tax=Ramlibacter henchirensis TaxID=204072 RepID=A0A4Z0BQW8_9BURK|nr:hypothetical protein [Ramlibacter henchirensis]TFZ00800.1 hypothetical protein EZ313_20365 [Ramlibacter henchirensis]